MNRDPNKSGRGKSLERGRKDLGKVTYIEEIILRAESGASSRAVVRVIFHARSNMRSRGCSISQLEPPLITEVEFKREEIGSRGS